uniref:Uncharacterized protein n=1 Tax=viral metagenome TaxID=1070528 RepID=A0A6C0D5U8_9ZZZZ
MNSEIPSIKVTNKKLNKEDINKLNKLSSILLENFTNTKGGGKKKRKTRKISKRD